MNGVIICEGKTDCILLQYFMEKVHQWKSAGRGTIHYQNSWSRELSKGSKSLTILEAHGCANIPKVLEDILERNFASKPNQEDAIGKIVLVTDRDETGTEAEFLEKISRILSEYHIGRKSDLINNQWLDCDMPTSTGKRLPFCLLVMVLPFQDVGALESFLLDAIADRDPYDKGIIDRGNVFVEEADKEKRYLTKRGYVTKAKFDVYFSVRTASEQFAERQDILKSIPWEEYPKINRDFEKLAEL